ncbi:E3 ubiquitin-protein ligase ATL42-like [Nymphaea colorata]|uniref:E3 ubiquitin-protein ligase ATL42-like n=1 Tax=Nymphaea colorata TaxID=210225 RepID=UPI00129E3520|nr:E3 ubiquitin-protein ligase ATL42-like [Nymphaea colorata]
MPAGVHSCKLGGRNDKTNMGIFTSKYVFSSILMGITPSTPRHQVEGALTLSQLNLLLENVGIAVVSTVMRDTELRARGLHLPLAYLAFYVLWSLAVIFLFLLVCCRLNGIINSSQDPAARPERSSGVDNKLIASLPLCTFSLLRGSSLGLDCSICLAKFADMDVLHVLPKCRHAFHVTCIDAWLEKQSSCPLCREKVEEEDISNFASSSTIICSSNMQGSVEETNTKVALHGEVEITSDHPPVTPNAEHSCSKKKDDEDGARSVERVEHVITIQAQ